MKYLSILVLLALPVAFSTCRDEDELPPITMEGKNTFGCLVNGKMFISKGGFGQSGTHAEVYKRPDTVAINIYAGNSVENQTIFISIIDSPDLRINGTYDFNNDKCCGLQYLNYDNEISCSYEAPVSGYVKLSKFDLSKGIVAGTFEFKAYSLECEDTVVITEGRFDIAEIFY